MATKLKVEMKGTKTTILSRTVELSRYMKIANWLTGTKMRNPIEIEPMEGASITVMRQHYGLTYYTGQVKAWILNWVFNPLIEFKVEKIE